MRGGGGMHRKGSGGGGKAGRGENPGGAIDPAGSCDLTHFPSSLNAPGLHTLPDHYLRRRF